MLEMLLKAAFVAAFVAVASALARRGGNRWAGLAAAAVSIPNLAVLAWQHGPEFVLPAAVGCLLSTLACLAFAHCYRGLAARARPASREVARVIGIAFAAALAALLTSALVFALQLNQPLSAPAAGAVALAACALSIRMSRRQPHALAAAVRDPDGRGRLAAWCAPLCAGFVCAVLCGVSTHLGPLLSGLLLGMPLVALCLAVGRHIEAGPAAAVASLQGYPDGLVLRALFALVLALAAPWSGSGPAFALAFALAIGLPFVMAFRGGALSSWAHRGSKGACARQSL